MTMALSLDEDGSRFRLLAISIVLLLHMVFFQVISYSQLPSLTPSKESRLRIQYIKSIRRPITRAPAVPENKPALASTRLHAPGVRNDPDETTRKGGQPAQASVMASIQGAPATSSGPLVLEWTNDTRSEPDFQRGILSDRMPASLAMNEPGRFRMRKQISGKDVIEGAAQLLGLWPPGYTTDPCPRIRRNIEGLKSDTRPPSRDLLTEELRRQQAFCR